MKPKPQEPKKKFAAAFHICSEDEDESKKSGDENPFQSTSTLLMNNAGSFVKGELGNKEL